MGKHYLIQASRLKCQNATDTYQEIYHENPQTSDDHSLPIFRKLLEKDFNLQQLYINQANQYLQEKEPLKALAFTMIGLQKIKGGTTTLSIMAAQFAYPENSKTYLHYPEKSNPYKIFKADATLASTYFPQQITQVSEYPDILLGAVIAHQTKDFINARKFYDKARYSVNNDSREYRRIQNVLIQIAHQENPHAPIYQNVSDDGCVIL